MASCLLDKVRSESGRRSAPCSWVPTARSSYVAHASYMQVCTIAKARAIIGVPSLESRTPCKAALFHWMTTLGVDVEFAVALCGEKSEATMNVPTASLRRIQDAQTGPLKPPRLIAPPSRSRVEQLIYRKCFK